MNSPFFAVLASACTDSLAAELNSINSVFCCIDFPHNAKRQAISKNSTTLHPSAFKLLA